jgi:hypothetical protein
MPNLHLHAISSIKNTILVFINIDRSFVRRRAHFWGCRELPPAIFLFFPSFQATKCALCDHVAYNLMPI